MNLATRTLFVFFAALPLSVACGGSDSGDGEATPAAQQAPQFVAKPNGKQLSETQACERVREAALKGCTLTQETCPSLLRKAYPLGDSKYYCSTWDEGVVQSCETYLASLTCEQRATYPCKLVYFEKTGTGAEVCEGAGGAGGAGGSAGAAGASGSTAGGAAGTAGAGGASGGASGAAGSTAGTAGAAGASAGAGGTAAAGSAGASAGTGGTSAGAAGAAGASAGTSGSAGSATAGAGGASAGAGGGN